MIVLTPSRRAVISCAALLALVLAVWGLRLLARDADPAAEPTAAQGNLRPVYSAQAEAKQLALTFDISWGHQTPPKVLDVLEREGVRATFFLSGPWSKNHPELVQRIVRAGHEVQSHGHAHVNFSSLSAQQVAANIQTAHAILKELTGKEPAYIRPPNGDFNQQSLRATKSAGYETVIWSVDSRDWMNPGVPVISRRVLERAHPGAIVLLHASDSCKQTHEALPALLAGLRQQGYEFALLSDLLQRHGVDARGHIR